jgi:hypothetical protein
LRAFLEKDGEEEIEGKVSLNLGEAKRRLNSAFFL